MLFVVMTPIESISEKHLSITLAWVHRIPEGITKRPRIRLWPKATHSSKLLPMSVKNNLLSVFKRFAQIAV